MISRTFAILLAASVLACPFWCKADSSLHENARLHERHACCASCPVQNTGNGADEGSNPCDDHSGTPACGSCICSGAVVEDFVFQDLILDGYCWISLPAVGQALPGVESVQKHAPPWTTMLDDGINRGRAMRCLMMSYLC